MRSWGSPACVSGISHVANSALPGRDASLYVAAGLMSIKETTTTRCTGRGTMAMEIRKMHTRERGLFSAMPPLEALELLLPHSEQGARSAREGRGVFAQMRAASLRGVAISE